MRNRTKDVSIVSGVAEEPLSLDVVKQYLLVEHDEDDAIIYLLITSARELLEKRLNISIGKKQLTTTFSHDGRNYYPLPYGPIGEITAVVNTYCEQSSVSFTTSQYSIIGEDFKRFKGARGLYAVTYNAGYTELPVALVAGMLKQIAWMYENRGDVTKTGEINQDVLFMLAGYDKNGWI